MGIASGFTSKLGGAAGDVAGQALTSAVAPALSGLAGPSADVSMAATEKASAERAAARLEWVWPVGIGIGLVGGLMFFSGRKLPEKRKELEIRSVSG
jgi:hypothetical protein